MPYCGWSYYDLDERRTPPGVGKGKGRGFTKPPLRRRKKRAR